MARIPGRVADDCRRPSPTSPSGPGSRGRRCRTPSTTPTCCAPTRSARVQEAIDELGYSPNRAARNLRTRASHLIGLRFSPAQEGTANAADGPVRALAGRDLARGGLPRAAVPRATPRTRSPATTTCSAPPRSTPSSSPTPTSATRRPPGSRPRRAPFVAFGRPWDNPDAGTRGSTSTAPPAPSSPPATCSSAATSGSPGSAGARTPGSARTAAPAGAGRCATAAWPPPGSPRGSRTPSPAAARRPRCCSTRRSPSAFVCASDTLAMGVLHTLADRGLVAGRDIAVVGFDDSQVAQVVPPGLTLGAAAARGGRRRDRQGARGAARPPARRQARRAPRARADRPRHRR